MAKKHPPGAEPFDVTLPDGFDPGPRRPELEAAAKQAGWTVERDGPTIIVRDVWTETRITPPGWWPRRSACRWSA